MGREHRVEIGREQVDRGLHVLEMGVHVGRAHAPQEGLGRGRRAQLPDRWHGCGLQGASEDG